MADIESRAHPDRSDWKLAPLIFQKIHQLLGPLSVDLFASHLLAQLPLYVSWKPDPLAMKTDAFSMNWTTLPGKIYANPPWGLIGRVLSTVQSQRVLEMVLVAPVWKAQACYPCFCRCWSENHWSFHTLRRQFSRCAWTISPTSYHS